MRPEAQSIYDETKAVIERMKHRHTLTRDEQRELDAGMWPLIAHLRETLGETSEEAPAPPLVN